MAEKLDATQHIDHELDEFADYGGDLVPFHADLAWRRLFNPATIRGFAALVGGVFFLFSDRASETLALILALVVVAWAISEFTVSGSTGRLGRMAIAAVLIALAVALLVWPDVSSKVISRLLGGAVLLAGARDLYRVARPPAGDGVEVWRAIRGVFVVAIGVSLWVAPSVMLGLVVTALAGFWIVTGIATMVGNVTTPDDDVAVTDVWPRIFRWLESRPHTADDRTQLYAKLFYEGELAVRRLSRFFLLMGFATTIAAFGIISDSTAVVIGAMLVAPLMTPLMGTSLSMVMGWPKRATMSAGVAFGGIFLAIAMSAIYGGMLAFEVDPITNSQVAARVAPTMIDLVIAVAAGGAGGFALSRPDVSDALPGVAVAIALVPPLAVVGLMLEAGHGEEALGALLLFATNMIAILLVGALVFLLTGVVPIGKLVSEREWIRNTATMVGILAIGVIVVLGTSSESIQAQAFDRESVDEVVNAWISDQSVALFSFEVGADEVEVVVVGAERPTGLDELSADLESELGRELLVTVRWVPEEEFVMDGRG